MDQSQRRLSNLSSAAIDSFMKHLPVVYKEFIAVGERVVQEHKDEVYAFTRDLLKN